ncbi:MAG: hypothetical protein KC486_28880 [Myxococcales bacterium]|nr:hypothetical protein [Myxococcales bacterium]
MGYARSNGLLHVYVAASSGELVDERRAVIDAVIAAGQLPGGSGVVAGDVHLGPTVLRAWLRRSDLVLVVLAGSDGGVEAETGQSLLEWELAAARSAGLPILAVALDDAMVSRSERRPLPSGPRERFAALREAMIAGGAATVGSLDQLRLAIVEGLRVAVDDGERPRWFREDRLAVDAAIAGELAHLSAEVRSLRARVAVGGDATPELGVRVVAGLTVEQWYLALEGRTIRDLRTRQPRALLDGLLDDAGLFALGVSRGAKPSPIEQWRFHEVGGSLVALGLATLEGVGPTAQIVLNDVGRTLVAILSTYAAGPVDESGDDDAAGVEPEEEEEEHHEQTVVATSDSGLRARIQSGDGREREEEKTNFWTLDPPPTTGRPPTKEGSAAKPPPTPSAAQPGAARPSAARPKKPGPGAS